MFDIKQLRDLVKLMVTNDLTELDLEGKGEKVRLRRRNGEPTVQYVPAPAPAAAAPAPAAAPASAPAAKAEDAPPAGSASAEGLETITSPMVGTYYAASSPDAKPFVKAGDNVTPDTVVCIVEAMKVFNEIKAETTGQIHEVLVESGQAVEFGQPLFLVKPK